MPYLQKDLLIIREIPYQIREGEITMSYTNQAEIETVEKAEKQVRLALESIDQLNNQIDKLGLITTAHRVLSETNDLLTRCVNSLEYLHYLLIQSDHKITFDRSKT